MDLLVASINAVVVAVVGGVVAWLGKGRFDGLDHKIDTLDTRLTGQIHSVEARLDGRIDSLEARFDGRTDSLEGRFAGLEASFGGRFTALQSHMERRFDTIQSSMDAMRSDLTQVALAVGVRLRARND